MEFPEPFRALAINMLLMLLDETIESDERLLRLMLDGIDAQGRQRLFEFLGTVLDGRYDDEQIDDLWAKTGTDAMFFTPGGTRMFLRAVHEYLAQEIKP